MENAHTSRLPGGALALLSGVTLAAFTTTAGLADLLSKWLTDEAYGHGFVVAIVSLYFLLTRLPLMEDKPASGRNIGMVAFILTMFMLVVSEAAQIHTLSQYLFVALLGTLAVVSWGLRAVSVVAPSLLLLLFVIPLPNFVQTMLTADLQLVSSKIGVWFLMLFGVPVYLEGNVIDLGTYKLQVVEACAGLNYLYPLLGIAFICACFLRTPYWQRALIVAAAVPITVVLNSFRIAIAGLLVNAQGEAAAEGFMHFFQGWLVFLACLLLLAGLMACLSRFVNRSNLAEELQLDLHIPRQGICQVMQTSSTAQLASCVLVAGFGLYAGQALGQRSEHVPARSALALFPMEIDRWLGTRGRISQANIATLDLSDYLLARYRAIGNAQPVELYVAYYDSQRENGGMHSPKVCLPGGGWEISRFEAKSVQLSEDAIRFNRVELRHGLEHRLVYYWFQQGGHTFANELAVKADIFRRSLVDNATNGALMRISTKIDAEGGTAAAEARLAAFMEIAVPTLRPYIPA
ncbi:MAG: VPLPA-CTERM-specific exosortase XrtD [Pseudomonadales bacterium]